MDLPPLGGRNEISTSLGSRPRRQSAARRSRFRFGRADPRVAGGSSLRSCARSDRQSSPDLALLVGPNEVHDGPLLDQVPIEVSTDPEKMRVKAPGGYVERKSLSRPRNQTWASASYLGSGTSSSIDRRRRSTQTTTIRSPRARRASRKTYVFCGRRSRDGNSPWQTSRFVRGAFVCALTSRSCISRSWPSFLDTRV
jgi:hypothetical protein